MHWWHMHAVATLRTLDGLADAASNNLQSLHAGGALEADHLRIGSWLRRSRRRRVVAARLGSFGSPRPKKERDSTFVITVRGVADESEEGLAMNGCVHVRPMAKQQFRDGEPRVPHAEGVKEHRLAV